MPASVQMCVGALFIWMRMTNDNSRNPCHRFRAKAHVRSPTHVRPVNSKKMYLFFRGVKFLSPDNFCDCPKKHKVQMGRKYTTRKYTVWPVGSRASVNRALARTKRALNAAARRPVFNLRAATNRNIGKRIIPSPFIINQGHAARARLAAKRIAANRAAARIRLAATRARNARRYLTSYVR